MKGHAVVQRMLICTMKWKPDPIAILVLASTLAMAGLVIFQYKWIQHSRELYDQVFHQRACMALCSTLEVYGEGAICNDPTCAAACEIPQAGAEGNKEADLINNIFFQTDLRKTLDFYNIDLSYELSQSTGEPGNESASGGPTCMVTLPSHDTAESEIISLDFPEKQSFMLGKMKFMIGASLIILVFTAMVLLLANWWLLKQKRLLQTNVDMYNNMAHEFRTPLTNINLAANLITKDGGSEKNEKFLDIIFRENNKLIQQVERILHLARLDNGDYDLRNERLPLRQLLQSICDELAIQIEERNASINIDDVPAHIEISGDRQHLSNVFRNLIDNAMKYAIADPVISIAAKEHNDDIHITVQDNGIGISPANCNMIFEKFQRVQEGNLHEQKGFGLGLAYVKKIVELHKGSIRVDSELNKGSRFNVYLPKYA